LRHKLFASIKKFVSLIIAESWFGLNKEQWASENDIWKFKKFEEFLAFVKVILLLQM
jgi:hypothetical protein